MNAKQKDWAAGSTLLLRMQTHVYTRGISVVLGLVWLCLLIVPAACYGALS